MLIENYVKFNIDDEHFWNSIIEYENEEYKYNIELYIGFANKKQILSLDVHIFNKIKYIKRRRSNFNIYKKSAIPYKHRCIVKDLIVIFEERVIMPLIMCSNNIEYNDLFLYLKDE